MTEQRVRDLLIHHGIQDGGPQLVADILALVGPDEEARLAYYTAPASPTEVASRVRLWDELTEADRDHWRALARALASQDKP